MKHCSDIRVAETPSDSATKRHPFAMCTGAMAAFYDKLWQARAQVSALMDSSDAVLAPKLQNVLDLIDGYEPDVTLIGQVKSGKTALANVLSGQIGLLPSDVNPLTSVVTTLHLNSEHSDGRTRAAFHLFGREEWDELVEGGGRLGALAGRAGVEDELETIKTQIAELRQMAQTRLGTSFEALLGKVHNYGYCDARLVERYVCLGDPDDIEADPHNTQGRFADITRSADLYISQPELPGPLCLRDTPGVNDTFMVREQITLRSLAESEVCVIVLSAHEALNTADLALVRLISSMENRQLVIFVNRIDELSKPSVQVPEIRASIMQTLSSVDAAKGATVLFGSALWGEVALARDFGDMDGDQRAALYDWAKAAGLTEAEDAFEFTWLLSGIPELMEAIYDRVIERSGKRLMEDVRGRLSNLASQARARGEVDAIPRQLSLSGGEFAALEDELEEIVEASCELLDDVLEKLVEDLRPRLRRIQENYVARATEALVAHLKEKGRGNHWTFGSSGLRFVLKSVYSRFADAATIEVKEVYAAAALAIRGVYADQLGVKTENFSVEPPQVPLFPAPVVLGQTTAIDLGNSWWKRWWQLRRGVESYAEDYARLIGEEVATMIRDLETAQFRQVLEEIRAVLRDFMVEQKDAALDVAASAKRVAAAPADGSVDDLIAGLNGVVSALDGTREAA